MELSDKVLKNISFSKRPEQPSGPDNSDTMYCSAGCGRLLVKPEFLKNARVLGKVNVLCQNCQKRSIREIEWKKRKERKEK